jgi:hypothetical protein
MFKKIDINKLSLINKELEIKNILNKYFNKNFDENFEELIVFRNFNKNVLSLTIKEPTLAQYININKKNIIKKINKKVNISDIKIKVG